MKTVILCLCLLCTSYAMANETNEANEAHCLKFYQGLEKNKVIDFFKYRYGPIHIEERANNEKMIRIRSTGRVVSFSSDIYSASYDLNGDGNDEYFYFITYPSFCGTMMGGACNLHLYENKGGKFKDIGPGHTFFRQYTNPTDEQNQNLICVLSTKDGPWRRFRITRPNDGGGWLNNGDSFEMKYSDGHYIIWRKSHG